MKFTKYVPISLSILFLLFPAVLSVVSPATHGTREIDIFAFILFVVGLLSFLVLSVIYALNFFFHGKVKFWVIVATFLSAGIVELFLQFISTSLVDGVVRSMNLLNENGSYEQIFYTTGFIFQSLLGGVVYYLAGRFIIFKHADNPVKPAIILGLLRTVIALIGLALMRLL